MLKIATERKKLKTVGHITFFFNTFLLQPFYLSTRKCRILDPTPPNTTRQIVTNFFLDKRP